MIDFMTINYTLTTCVIAVAIYHFSKRSNLRLPLILVAMGASGVCYLESIAAVQHNLFWIKIATNIATLTLVAGCFILVLFIMKDHLSQNTISTNNKKER